MGANEKHVKPSLLPDSRQLLSHVAEAINLLSMVRKIVFDTNKVIDPYITQIFNLNFFLKKSHRVVKASDFLPFSSSVAFYGVV